VRPWIPLNDLSRGWLALNPPLQEIQELCSSGHFIHGTHHEAFESELAGYLGVKGVVGVGNGTDALELAMRAVGLREGDGVVTVANAGSYSSLAARRMGARIRFADVDPSTHLMTADTLADVIARDTSLKAVVATHLYGNPLDMEAIAHLCEVNGLLLIEDCAQALGALVGERRVGSFGNASAFSFYPTKNLGALGDAGAVASGSEEVINRLKSLRQYGWGERYNISLEGGMNSRLDELQALILRRGLPRLEGLNARRRDILARYMEAAQRAGLSFAMTRDLTQCAPHLAVLVSKSIEQRQAIAQAFLESNIQVGMHYPLPDYEQVGLGKSQPDDALPVTRSLKGRIISIPLFPELLEEEISRISGVLGSPTH